MKIIAVCQSGLGTSFMVEMNIKNALSDMGVDMDNFEVSHTDSGTVSPDMADYFFTEKTLADALTRIPQEKLILLDSIIDADELKEKVKELLDKNKIAHS